MTSVDSYLRQTIFNLITDDDQVPAEKSGLFNELVNTYTEYLVRSVDADVAYMKATTVSQYVDKFQDKTPSLSWLGPVSKDLSDKYQDIAEKKLLEAELLWGEVEAAYRLLIEV